MIFFLHWITLLNYESYFLGKNAVLIELHLTMRETDIPA